MAGIVKNAEEYENIMLFLESKEDDIILTKHVKYRLKQKSKEFIIVNNLLYKKDEGGLHKRVFHAEQQDLMELEVKKLHNLNHYGINRFEECCNQQYFGVPRSIVRKTVENCIVCMQAQPLKTKESQIHITAQRPIERLMIDLIDMRKYSCTNNGYAWILTIIDVYSKYAWAYPLSTKTGASVAKSLESLFLTNTGPPVILQSDNGKEFINHEMQSLCARFKILFKNSRPRHPQANGQVERFNQTLTRYLQKHIYEEEINSSSHSKNWIRHLDKVLYSYNLAKHAATKKTPFTLRLQIPGFNTVLKDVADTPDENFDDLGNEIMDSSKNFTNDDYSCNREKKNSIVSGYFERMDRHSLVHISKNNINIGDMVLVAHDYDTNVKTKKLKLSSFYSDKCKVTEILSNNRVKIIKKDGSEEIVSISRVKLSK